jgi:2-isopropylmalate synthase
MANVRGQEAIDKLTGVTPKMFSPEIRNQMTLPPKIVINDITLREGRQIEGVILTKDECIRIAEILVHDLNVPMIQAIGGYTQRDRDFLKAIARFLEGCGRKIRTEAMTSAHQNYPRFNKEQLLETVSNIGEAGFGVVICVATSDNMLKGCALHRGQKMSVEDLRKQEIEIAVAAIEHARKVGMTEINVNFQDFLRADLEFLKQFARAVAAAGANTICLDDFGGGLAAPILYTHLFRIVRKEIPETTALGVHAHNNAGMAVATALASVEGGCEVVNVGVNAYGDAAGHVSMAETVYNLEFVYGFDTGIRVDRLRPASILIADMMRQQVPKMAPLVGDNAFVLIADKHHSFPEYPFLFCPMVPELVGNKARPGFGDRAGPFGLKLKLKEQGLTLPEDRIQPMLRAMEEEMRWRKRAMTDAEFRDLVATVAAASPKAA